MAKPASKAKLATAAKPPIKSKSATKAKSATEVKSATEKIFLLEFLVDDLEMKAKCDCSQPPGETCVSFTFLDNVPLDVCEGDFDPEGKFSANSECSKTGKSVLFSLSPSEIEAACKAFNIEVTVFRKMRPGVEPDRISIGSVLFTVAELFIKLVKDGESSPAAKVLKCTYDLVDSKGETVGEIGVFLRLSCYGKTIVTQFQMNMDDKTVLFKDKEGSSLYRYKKSKKKSRKENTIEDLCAPSCPSRNPVDPLPPPAAADVCPPNMGSPNLKCPMPSPSRPSPPSPPQNFPPPNMNCPQQPCFPPQPPPRNLNCPMQPCFPPPQQPQMNMPPRNANCPMQPCFPPPQQPQMNMPPRNSNCPMQPCFPPPQQPQMNMPPRNSNCPVQPCFPPPQQPQMNMPPRNSNCPVQPCFPPPQQPQMNMPPQNLNCPMQPPQQPSPQQMNCPPCCPAQGPQQPDMGDICQMPSSDYFYPPALGAQSNVINAVPLGCDPQGSPRFAGCGKCPIRN